MIRTPLRILPFLSFLLAVILWSPDRVEAAAAATHPGSEDFIATPFEWELNITMDEVSGSVTSLIEVFDDNGDDSASLVGSAELGPATSPARSAQRSPIDSNPALGATLVNDDLENRGFSSGLFTGGLGERIRITSSTSLSFNLEYVGPNARSGGDAVICLMPLQLAIFEGAGGVDPASAIFSFVLEVDDNEVYASTMRLSGADSDSAELTSLDGQIRTDGVFFEDDANNAFGFNFPALDLRIPMGVDFFPGDDSIEANLRFSTTIEGADSGWGGYAGQQSSFDPANIFIPVSTDPIPEPGGVTLLAVGLGGLILRRKR